MVGEMDYTNLLNYSVKLVEDKLRQVFSYLKEEAMGVSTETLPLPEAVEDYTLRGGKRLRAFLALIGYWSKSWGAGEVDVIANVMASIELLQSYLLVHDDLMDKDELRRGGPTVHVIFREKCREGSMLGDCAHYGVSQAITAGDYLEATAVEMLASTGLPGDVLGRLLRTYSRGLRLVAFGQYLDVLGSYLPLSRVGEEHVILVHKLKTASYTVELPLHLGAIASMKYDERLLHELSVIAIPAGIAFQLRDDVIGLYGDPKLTGKPVGSDVRGKKKTLLIVKAYQLAGDGERAFLEEVYDRLSEEQITDEHVKRVQEIVRESGSLSYNEELVGKYVREAEGLIDDAKEISSEAKDSLRWLLKKLAYRQY